jgi:ADP-dependent NAD(P)H-hydrate dehydratase / NAD(P)H-hydrate epimerase
MPIPVITVAQMREWERTTWATGQTEGRVIARVGEHLARRVCELTGETDRVVILAGKGHNGDDARAMTGHLRQRDAVFIEAVDPLAAMERFSQALGERPPTLIVDALFGIGLSRPLNHDWLRFIARINHAHVPILSVDVPSGLNAETGDVATCAIRATETLTVGAPKRGMLLGEAQSYVGRLDVAGEVGLVPCPATSDVEWTLPSDFVSFPPPRATATHKGSFGHLAIVAGSMGFHGAAVLASRGAQRARPGLITLFTQRETYVPIASQTQAVMVNAWDAATDWNHFNALLFGPGLAAVDLPASVAEAMREAWQQFDGAVVVDASALSWLPEREGKSTAPRVITPHPGEAARLLGVSTPEVQRDRFLATRELSRKFGGCWVVLKGHQTVVGRAGGSLFVNGSGSGSLAQGGSGDLLAGYIAGWLAQPLLQPDVETVLRYSVWEHGSAAERLDDARKVWTVEELAAELGLKHG